MAPRSRNRWRRYLSCFARLGGRDDDAPVGAARTKRLTRCMRRVLPRKKKHAARTHTRTRSARHHSNYFSSADNNILRLR